MPAASNMSCAVRNCSRAARRQPSRRSHSPYSRRARASDDRSRVWLNRPIASWYRASAASPSAASLIAEADAVCEVTGGVDPALRRPHAGRVPRPRGRGHPADPGHHRSGHGRGAVSRRDLGTLGQLCRPYVASKVRPGGTLLFLAAAPSLRGHVRCTTPRTRPAAARQSLQDCVLLCFYHHRVVIHQWPGWTLVLNPDGTTTAWNNDHTKTLHSHGPPPSRE